VVSLIENATVGYLLIMFIENEITPDAEKE